jgi:cell division protein ZapA
MCALQFAAQVEQKQISGSQDNETALTRLQNLDKKLSELLSK